LILSTRTEISSRESVDTPLLWYLTAFTRCRKFLSPFFLCQTRTLPLLSSISKFFLGVALNFFTIFPKKKGLLPRRAPIFPPMGFSFLRILSPVFFVIPFGRVSLMGNDSPYALSPANTFSLFTQQTVGLLFRVIPSWTSEEFSPLKPLRLVTTSLASSMVFSGLRQRPSQLPPPSRGRSSHPPSSPNHFKHSPLLFVLFLRGIILFSFIPGLQPFPRRPCPLNLTSSSRGDNFPSLSPL